jgi:hypothetical protein
MDNGVGYIMKTIFLAVASVFSVTGSLNPATAAVIILDPAHNFQYLVEPGAKITAGLPDGSGPLNGSGLLFSLGAPSVADFTLCSDDSLGTAGCTGLPRDLVASGEPLTILVLSSQNRYAMRLLTHLGKHGCADSDAGITCAARGGYSSFSIEPAFAVPEPSSWAMLTFGFAMAGGAMRSGIGRRAKVRLAA